MSFNEEIRELQSAEDFLDYFGMEYDERIVQVNRLHILQRFHDYLADARERMPETEEAVREVYGRLLLRAYRDFVDSDALTEKVFKVFHRGEPQIAFVPLSEIK